MTVRIEQITLPASLDSDTSADFVRSAAVSNAVELDTWGHDDFAVDAEERLVMVQPSPDRQSVIGVIRDGDGVVANVQLRFPQRDNLRTGYVQIEVLPRYRRRGFATALLAFAEERMAERGRTIIMSWSDARIDGAAQRIPVLVPPTGAGSFPADHPSAVLAVHGGFELVQVDRQSILLLGPPSGAANGIGRLEDEAASIASARYEVVTWTDRCPDALVEDYALLRQRMSTDPPLGGFAQEEESWDADRIRREEDKSRAGGTIGLVCAARHRVSGQLVGHTVLERFASKPAVVYQEDTLVLREHRGHRLGLWLKSVNLLRVRDEWSSAERVYTWNAEENTHMLAINVALGFAPSGRTAGWQKVLAAQ